MFHHVTEAIKYHFFVGNGLQEHMTIKMQTMWRLILFSFFSLY